MKAQDTLVGRIRALRQEPNQRTSMARYGHDIPELYPPASAELVHEAEHRLGFSLPPLLRTLYLQVENGGFGPGYGLWGLEGGYPTCMPMGAHEENIVTSYLESISLALEEGIQPVGRRLVVCDWGCCNGSAIDCTTDEGEMLFMRDDGVDLREEISFRQWTQDWADGVDLWSRAYGPKRRTDEG